MNQDDLLSADAVALAAMIRGGEVSTVDVVAAHLARIEAVNPAINAVVQLAPEAMERARAADASQAKGDTLGSLHGIPFTVKDWVETQGLICAAGFAERADYRPRRDAVVVARMRDAGAILLGKTNVNQGAPIYSRPNNPRDLARTPGASSSGEAAIIAAGGSPMGLGSDSGGSVRWPAHCCGVAGLKPTTGRVPSTGHFPRVGHLSDPRTTIGPMARSVRDLSAMLAVIGGADAGDPSSISMPLGDPAAVDLRGLRVAWHTALPGAQPTPETVAAVSRAAAALADRGARVSEATPPRLEEPMPITRAYWSRLWSMSLTDWRPQGPPKMTALQMEEMTFQWERFARSMSVFMVDWDVVLSPAAPRTAPLHDAVNRDEFLYTLPYSLTGQPAAVIPFGVSSEGPPIGVQVAARRWEDHVALAAAAALEAVSAPLSRAMV